MDNSEGRHTGENHGANFYHTDTCFVDNPPRCTVLHARTMPPSGGGDTGFLDQVSAYESLPEATKQRLEGVQSVHGWSNDRLFGKGGNRDPDSTQNELADVYHPLVRTHAETQQKALYINLARNKGVVGWGEEAGVALLQELQDHAEAVAPTYRHPYRLGDVYVPPSFSFAFFRCCCCRSQSRGRRHPQAHLGQLPGAAPLPRGRLGRGRAARAVAAHGGWRTAYVKRSTNEN
jgi:hypothetical protein